MYSGSGVLNPGDEATPLPTWFCYSLVTRSLGMRPKPPDIFIFSQLTTCMDCGESSDDVNGSRAPSKTMEE